MRKTCIYNSFTWMWKSLYVFLFLLYLQLPQKLYAVDPCNNMSSISEVWSCPGGGQGFLSIISDGCHVLVRYESCNGSYSEIFLSPSPSVNPNTGNRKLNELFQFIQSETERLQMKIGRSNNDVKYFLSSTINKIVKEKLIDEIENVKDGIKGKTLINSADQREISIFEQMVNKVSKLEKKDIKKDDK